MLTINEIKERLKDRNLSEVSRQTGVSYSTIYNITKAENLNGFIFQTIEALSNYLDVS